MSILIIVGIIFASVAAAAIIAPALQFAFKLTEGQKNSYADSFKICFYATFANLLITSILPLFITAPVMNYFWEGLGTIVGLVAFTYFIAKELGDLKRSFLIALLLEGLLFLIALSIAFLIIAIGITTAVVS